MIEEIEVKVIPYKIKAKCSSCKTGEYLPTGKTYPTNPPLYEHECTDCEDTTKVRGKQYPEIIWKEMEE